CRKTSKKRFGAGPTAKQPWGPAARIEPRDSRVIALQCCFSESAGTRMQFCATLAGQIICCIRGREELHCTGHERRARQLLSLVSIYLESIQAAGGVSVSE